MATRAMPEKNLRCVISLEETMSEVIPLNGIPAPSVVEVGTIKPALMTGFVSIDGAALYLGMGKRFVEGLISTQEIPSYKFGRSRRIRVADLDEWAGGHVES